MDKELLKILACPACRGSVFLREDKIECSQCHRRYPVKNGIPVLIVEEAELKT